MGGASISGQNQLMENCQTIWELSDFALTLPELPRRYCARGGLCFQYLLEHPQRVAAGDDISGVLLASCPEA